MSLVNHTVSNQPIFGHLALFVCHLFIDGPFHSAKLSFDHGSLNYQFLSEMESDCPTNIPWKIENLLEFKMDSEIKNQNEIDDSVLNVIWIEMDKFDETLTVRIFPNLIGNQLFILNTNGKMDNMAWQRWFDRINTSKTSSLVLLHDWISGYYNVHLLFGNKFQLVFQQDHWNNGILFDQTFAKHDNKWLITIPTVNKNSCIAKNIKCGLFELVAMETVKKILALKFDSIFEELFKECNGSQKNDYVRQIPSTIYGELSNEAEILSRIALNQMKTEKPQNIRVHFRLSNLLPNEIENAVLISSGEMTDLRVIFVQRHNEKHESMILSQLASSRTAHVILYWFLLTTSTLYFMRLMSNEIDIRYTTALFEMGIVLVGGGILRYNRKWEKVFFMFMIFGAFFLQSFGMFGDLYEQFVIDDQNVIDTFDKLAKQNAPIHLDTTLNKNLGAVHEMIW